MTHIGVAVNLVVSTEDSVSVLDIVNVSGHVLVVVLVFSVVNDILIIVDCGNVLGVFQIHQAEGFMAHVSMVIDLVISSQNSVSVLNIVNVGSDVFSVVLVLGIVNDVLIVVDSSDMLGIL